MEEIIRTDSIDSRTEYRGMVITDLDGTLLDPDSNLKIRDYNTLVHLKQTGYLTVLATGRHLYSLYKRIDDTFPVDYVIFSSGAGIWDQKNKHYLRMITMEPGEVQKAASLFCGFSLDFAVHSPIPDNHYFSYFLKKNRNKDFERRIQYYKEFASRWESLPPRYPRASQLLAIITGEIPGHDNVYNDIRTGLPGFTVIRTTSPLDHESLWIEIFPHIVSKGQASSWLASRFCLDRKKTLAVGNDYNDIDLLSWAKTAYVVSNAPDELKKLFPSVVSHNECGFSDAVNRWLDAGRI
jgi:HAD superfamily hydrolase (TIGR01484 family)